MKMATAGINHPGEHTHLLPLSGEMLWPVLKLRLLVLLIYFHPSLLSSAGKRDRSWKTLKKWLLFVASLLSMCNSHQRSERGEMSHSSATFTISSGSIWSTVHCFSSMFVIMNGTRGEEKQNLQTCALFERSSLQIISRHLKNMRIQTYIGVRVATADTVNMVNMTCC